MVKDKTIEVDGAKVAARILARFPSEERERIVASIRVANPSSAVRIEELLVAQRPVSTPRRVSIEKITEVSDRDLQAVLREVTQRDLAVSLRSASAEAREKIFNNLSETRQNQVLEDLQELPPMRPADVEAAQSRIMRQVEDLYPGSDSVSAPRRLRSRLA